MTRLSHIASEARRLLGRVPESRLHTLQQALVACCEEQWQVIRGPEPVLPLAHALWSVTPPLGDLFLDLCRAADLRLEEVLSGLSPSRGMAALVLAEIERGDEEGVHVAYESLMVLETPSAVQGYSERVAAALRGGLEVKKLHHSSKQEPLAKALAILVEQTGRHDLKSICETIRQLALEPRVPDEAQERLRAALKEAGIHFCGIEDDHIHFELRGRSRKPVSLHRALENLLAIRRVRLD